MSGVYSIVIVSTILSAMTAAGNLDNPPDVISALELSGENRFELENVLKQFEAPEDSLKLRAAYYLVANMEGHGYVTYYMCDSSGARIEFNVLDYPDFDALLEAADSIGDLRGEIDFEKNDMVLDVETIKADFLINQIDLSFKAWRGKPWARGYSFDSFCAYILPYRGSDEPLEYWRGFFLEKYDGLESKMIDRSDPVEAASLINDDIKSWFGFDPRYYYHPTDQGLSEMMAGGLGRCEDMTNLAIYALRANGLAVTSDYTPHWANSGNNHAWNAIVTSDGRVIPFMGAESNPGVYKLANKMAKVYRKTYGRQLDNLIFQERKQEAVPRWLAGRSYIDVTSSYTGVCDVTVEFEKEIPDSVDIAYLCVFNSGEWKATQWGRIENGKAAFAGMGNDNIAYLPALYLNEEIVPLAAPFILGGDCGTRKLSGDGRNIEVSLVSTTSRKLEISTDGVARSYLTSGREYELSYWDNGWQSLGEVSAGDGPLRFENVPADRLYWLVEEDSKKEERIFTIEDNVQVWW